MSNVKKILIINGPNLNMLGSREKEIYGEDTYSSFCEKLTEFVMEKGAQAVIFQSNCEGEIINRIQTSYDNTANTSSEVYDAIIINPAAYTHYSYAIYDALRACPLPKIEVHLSNIYSREEFRHKSVTAPACTGQISGLGIDGYFAAISFLIK